MMSAGPSQERVVIGEVIGVYGVKGWLKVYSYTRPKENIFTYTPWTLKSHKKTLNIDSVEGQVQGKGLIAKLDGVVDRDTASDLVGAEISIAHEQLPVLPLGHYYWSDLIQLDVVNLAGVKLGKVTELQETGANDVLVVEGEQRCLIPWVYEHYIKEVNLAAGQLKVDWEAEE